MVLVTFFTQVNIPQGSLIFICLKVFTKINQKCPLLGIQIQHIEHLLWSKKVHYDGVNLSLGNCQ